VRIVSAYYHANAGCACFRLPAQPREKPRRYAVLAIFALFFADLGKVVASQSQAGGGRKKFTFLKKFS